MKKTTYCVLAVNLILVLCFTGISQTVYYAQLYPGDNKKFVFQIKPDQNYMDVNAYINFYKQNGSLIRDNVSFPVTKKEGEYIIKNKIENRIFDIPFRDVASMKVVHVKCNEIRGKADGQPPGIPVSISNSGNSLDQSYLNSLKPKETPKPPDPVIVTPPASNLPAGNINSFTDQPCITGVGNNRFYFFGKSNNNKIYYSKGELGGGGSQWIEVAGGGLISSNPAASAVNNQVYVAAKGMDNNIWLNQGDTDGHFGAWASMNFQSDTYPSLTGAGTKIYFFAKRSDGRIFYNYAESGAGGVGWNEVSGNGIAGSAPSSAAIGNYVFVAVKGLDQQIYYNQGEDGKFGQWIPMQFRTNVAPSLVTAGKYIYFFATRFDGKIMYNRALLSQSFEGWKEVEGNGLTDSPVSAGSVGNHIFITMKGRDGKYYLNQGDLDRPFNSYWSPMQ